MSDTKTEAELLNDLEEAQRLQDEFEARMRKRQEAEDKAEAEFKAQEGERLRQAYMRRRGLL